MSDSPFTPFSVGAYTCIHQLGIGRSGELYLALDRSSGHRAAIRKISPEALSERETSETVLGNLYRVKNLSHPNIVPITDIIRIQDSVFVVMDYIEGINLGRILKELDPASPLPPEVATLVTSQICQALDHAHHQTGGPLVHGALWPQNVLLSKRGQVLVTDFGTWVIQGKYGEQSIRTHFSYRSPEHVMGDLLTPASDIFCVGILLHEMLTARSAFLGQTLMETLERVEQASLPPAPEVSPELYSVLVRCLAPATSARHSSVAALISELSTVVPGSGSREIRGRLVERIQPFCQSAEQLMPVPIESSAKPASPGLQKDRLIPEPIKDGARPLTPLPGLDHATGDEPTNISPAEMTEALIAMSKDSTNAGKSGALEEQIRRETSADDPTYIDPIIPGITGPEITLDDEDDDGATTQVDSPGGAAVGAGGERVPGVLVDWETSETTDLAADARPSSSSISESSTDHRGKASLGIQAASVEVEADTLPGDEEETTTGTMSPRAGAVSGDEEPTNVDPSVFETETSSGPQLSVIGLDTLFSDPGEVDEEEPTTLAVPARDEDEDEDDDEELTAPAKGQLRHSTLLGHGRADGDLAKPGPDSFHDGDVAGRDPADVDEAAPRAPGSTAAPRQADAPGMPDIPAAPQISVAEPSGGEDSFGADPLIEEPSRDESLDFAYNEEPSAAEFPEVGYVTSDSFSSGEIPSREDSVFAAPGPRPRRRFSAAHSLLVVAIIVFLVAIGLLMRRLFWKPAAPFDEGAAITSPVAPDAETATIPDSAPTANKKRPDAARAASGADTARAADAAPTRTHASGRHLDNLLHGKGALKPGVLRITSAPSADVFIDQRLVGKSPVSTKQAPGKKVKLVIVAPGYQVHRKTLDLPSSKGLAITVKLEKGHYPRTDGRKRGWLLVRCPKKDLRRISLNGTDTGFRCSKIIFRLKPAYYKVGFVSLFTGKTKTRRVWVGWGRKKKIWGPRQ